VAEQQHGDHQHDGEREHPDERQRDAITHGSSWYPTWGAQPPKTRGVSGG
jgi:hypothetical protein